jgi:hypothetical protein
LRLPQFTDIWLTDGRKVGSPTRRPLFTSRAIVQLEGLGKLKKSTSSGTRTGDLPAYIIVPQPSMLPNAHNVNSVINQFPVNLFYLHYKQNGPNIALCKTEMKKGKEGQQITVQGHDSNLKGNIGRNKKTL